MVAGWLRPRHERSPSTQVHSDLLNSFVTGKLEKFANHFLKSWTMKASTCLPVSHEFTALCPPTLSLNCSASTDTSCRMLGTVNRPSKASAREKKCTALPILDMSLGCALPGFSQNSAFTHTNQSITPKGPCSLLSLTNTRQGKNIQAGLWACGKAVLWKHSLVPWQRTDRTSVSAAGRTHAHRA